MDVEAVEKPPFGALERAYEVFQARFLFDVLLRSSRGLKSACAHAGLSLVAQLAYPLFASFSMLCTRQ